LVIVISEWPSHAAGDRRLRKVGVWQGEERGEIEGRNGEATSRTLRSVAVGYRQVGAPGLFGASLGAGRSRAEDRLQTEDGQAQAPTSTSSQSRQRWDCSVCGQVRRLLAQVTREEEQCRSRRHQGQRRGPHAARVRQAGAAEQASKQSSSSSSVLTSSPGRPWFATLGCGVQRYAPHTAARALSSLNQFRTLSKPTCRQG
jgi:hypothetical protein